MSNFHSVRLQLTCYRSQLEQNLRSSQLSLLKIDDTSIDLCLAGLSSSTSVLLAALPEAGEHSSSRPESAELKNLRKVVSSFATVHEDSKYRVKAVKLYADYFSSHKIDSRKYVQAAGGYYDAAFQLICIKLGQALEDPVFAYLAKREMFHAWLDIPGKLSGIGLEHFQELFKMLPYSGDFLVEFAHAAHKRLRVLGNSNAQTNTYLKSWQLVHPKSWRMLPAYDRDADSARSELPNATYRRTIDNTAAPAKQSGNEDKPKSAPANRRVKKRYLGNSKVFHWPDPNNFVPGDDHLHVFIQRDVKKELGHKFKPKPREVHNAGNAQKAGAVSD